jgi:AcrR family transcriptional regulator
MQPKNSRLKERVQPPTLAPLPLNKHQQRTESTKRKLRQAALRIFARHGFEAARIEEIAAEAGHTRGAFYAHFHSKEDLFFSMLEDEAHFQMERLEQALRRSTTDEERLKVLRELYVSRIADIDWSILILEFKLYAFRHPKLKAKLTQRYRNIRTKVKLQSVPMLSCQPRDELTLKISLQAILHGLALETAYDPDNLSETKVKAVLGLLFDSLVGEFVPTIAATRQT